MHRRIFLSLLCLALTVPAFSQTALGPLADRLWAKPLPLPSGVPVVSLTPADSEAPRKTFTIQRTYAADGSFAEDWKTDDQTSHQEFRSNGTLAKSVLTDTAKGFTVVQTIDARRTTARTVVTLKGATKSDKTVDLSPGIALRNELPHLVVQSWKAGIRDGLRLQSLSPDGGMVGDFQIVFRTVGDPTTLSDKYQYPPEFKAAFGPAKTYVVADMALQGVGAFFYPHHFYLVYEAAPDGLDWRGYFGEDPRTPVFQFLKNEGEKVSPSPTKGT